MIVIYCRNNNTPFWVMHEKYSSPPPRGGGGGGGVTSHMTSYDHIPSTEDCMYIRGLQLASA